MKRILLPILLLKGVCFGQNAPTMVVTFDNTTTLCNNQNKLVTVVVTDLDADPGVNISLPANSVNSYLNFGAINQTIISPTVKEFTFNLSVQWGTTAPNTSYTDQFTITADDNSNFNLSSQEDITDINLDGQVDVTLDLSSVAICSNGLPFDLTPYVDFQGGDFNMAWGETTNILNPVVANQFDGMGEMPHFTYVYLNDNGCQGTADAYLNIHDAPVATVTVSPSDCETSNGDATVVINDQLPSNAPYNVYWSTGFEESISGSTSMISSLSSGVYYANITDNNGCNAVGTAHIADSDIAVVHAINPLMCENGSGLIDLTITSSGNVTQTFWSNGITTEDMIGHAGEYSVEIHTDNNCHYYGVYEIPDSSLRIELDYMSQDNCDGLGGQLVLNVSGGSNSYIYDWSLEGSTATFAPNSFVDQVSAGIYTCQVADAVNGCEASYTGVIASNTNTYPYQVSVVNTGCGESNGAIDVAYYGQDPTIWEWSNGETTEDLTDLAAGVYTLKYQGTSGCPSYRSYEVLSKRPYQPQICLLTVDTSLVYNEIIWEKDPSNIVDGYSIYRETTNYGEFELVTTLPYAQESAYIDNAASPVDRSWRYYITSYDACGESYGSLIHKTIHIVVESTDGTNYDLAWDDYEGISYTSIDLKRFDPSTGLWEIVANLPAGTNNYTDTPTGILEPEYLISFVLTSPCTSSKAQDHNASRSNNTSSVFNPGQDTDLSVIENKNGKIMMYPNPTQDNLNVYMEHPEKFELIRIVNINGELIYTQLINSNLNVVPTKELSAGIYFVQIYSSTGVVTEKIIKR